MVDAIDFILMVSRTHGLGFSLADAWRLDLVTPGWIQNLKISATTSDRSQTLSGYWAKGVEMQIRAWAVL